MRVVSRSRFLLCLLAGAASALGGARPSAAQEVALQIGTATILFNRSNPDEHQAGRLLWRGGIVFSASAPEFGGWSDLHVSSDGARLAAVSEQASWFTATIDYDAAGDLGGLSEARLGPLHGLDGKVINRRGWTNAEGVTQLPDGAWLVVFEGNHRIWRYSALDGTPVAIDGPAEMARLPRTAGIEALTALPDGRVVAMSGGYGVRPGIVSGWIGTPGGGTRYTWQDFSYTVGGEFHPSAMAPLPGGGFAVVEHSFDINRGARCRVMHVAEGEIRPGATVTGTELAVLQSPNPVDNFEGLSVTRGKRGETLLWINSNDNFNPLQRNMLLLFELVPAK